MLMRVKLSATSHDTQETLLQIVKTLNHKKCIPICNRRQTKRRIPRHVNDTTVPLPPTVIRVPAGDDQAQLAPQNMNCYHNAKPLVVHMETHR
jgi:hypothetical protein